MSLHPRAVACLLVLTLLSSVGAQSADDMNLGIPAVGTSRLLMLTPRLLELDLTTAKSPGRSPLSQWSFVDASGQTHLPRPDAFVVSAAGRSIPVAAVGFRRRVSYAPLNKWDLRLGNLLYLELRTPVPEGSTVQVTNPDGRVWSASVVFRIQATRERWTPIIHVNQTGYVPALPKTAMVGYYLGSLGELNLTNLLSSTNQVSQPSFALLDARSNREVFRGTLTARPDQGFPFPSYQSVWQADFSNFKTPGEYRLFVPGLGCSFPFLIDEGVAGAFARTYALGIYHQRCGTSNALPFTRFTHGPCHTRPAEVPTMASKFAFVNECLAKMSADYKDNPRHTAPQLSSVAASLYPFVRQGVVDVSGGHHDAGDYSKYTINSAAFIHFLVFSADVFPGAGALDNLGLPESGDGKSDLLEEAKWEADFLVKMQDSDGGFYFLVYPRDREYEDNVLPDHGDPQVVFPKNTSATAAATAALAQCASSPLFRKQFPQAAARYLASAKKGWQFLQRALDKYGKDGAYQKITHYGNDFMHDDELAWAACELFLATGEPAYHQKLQDWLNPSDAATRRWGWWRLYASYGCAIRSYAFAARTGRLKREQLNPLLLEQCEQEIADAGADDLHWANQSAYGTSLPEEAKRTLNVGWYFSDDAAFELAVACQLDYPAKRDVRPAMLTALLSNLNYEQGCNPVNVVYLTGLGWERQHAIVDQYALNARQALPPSGIPLGNIQAGLGWNYRYEDIPEKLSFPFDGSDKAPYPFYDRWEDGFNLSQEFVILNQARALGCLAWLMAQTSLKDQAWRAATGQLSGLDGLTPGKPVVLHLQSPGLDLTGARIVWEANNQPPVVQRELTLKPGSVPLHWVEAEAQLPDGRRVFAVRDFSAQ
jgi:hypothetical protein